MLNSKKTLFSILFFLISSTFLFLYPSENDFQSIKIKEVLSIGDLEDDKLYQWVGVITDSKHNIFVTDNMDYSLKKFDDQGNLLKKTGRKGEGPGEFLAPRYLGHSELFVYVSDQYRPSLQVFDDNLNYKRSIKIQMPISDFKIISDDDIAISTLSYESIGKIFVFNSKGELKYELIYSHIKAPYGMNRVQFEIDAQGYYYVAYSFKDTVAKFNPEGKNLWSKKILGIKEVKREKIGPIKLPTKMVYKDIELDSSGNIYVLGGSFSEHKSRDVYVLNPEGKLLTTITLPDSSHCIHIGRDDFLYSRANEGVTLKKYKLEKIF